MPRTTVRTAQPYDFNEMNPGQFEDRSELLGNLDGVEWVVRPVAVGRLGADEGKDILLRERVRGRRGRMGERTWLVQVKRYKEIGPRQLVRIVDKAIPAGSTPPHHVIAAVACRASARAIREFANAANARGVSEAEVWTRETLNDLLLLPQNARVAAFYFGDGRAIEGTVPLPLALDRSSGRDLQLQARAEQVRELRDSPGDVIIVGPAGSGRAGSRLKLTTFDSSVSMPTRTRSRRASASGSLATWSWTMPGSTWTA